MRMLSNRLSANWRRLLAVPERAFTGLPANPNRSLKRRRQTKIPRRVPRFNAMYVFVTVAELTGTAKQLSLGQAEETITLKQLLERCLDQIDKHLPEQHRENSRHFWFNDHIIPFEHKYLSDLASTVNVTLELRPDYYM